MKDRLTVNEYIIADMPSGAYEAKNTTSEIKWQVNLHKKANTVDNILCDGIRAAKPKDMYGNG